MAKRKQKKRKTRKPAPKTSGLTFNHAMLYSRDVARATEFYVKHLGFKHLDEFSYGGHLVYSRVRSPHGDSTIAVHLLEQGKSIPENEGVRLYLEIKNVESFCEKLEAAGVTLDKPPQMMPWGWKHAYLRDPDGHELSIYWAGAGRFRKTVLK